MFLSRPWAHERQPCARYPDDAPSLYSAFSLTTSVSLFEGRKTIVGLRFPSELLKALHSCLRILYKYQGVIFTLWLIMGWIVSLQVMLSPKHLCTLSGNKVFVKVVKLRWVL